MLINGSLRAAKIIQILLILAVPSFLDTLDILARFSVPPPFYLSDGTLKLIIIVLAILGAVDLAFSYFLPRMMIRGYKGYKRKPQLKATRQLFSIFVVRAAMLEAVAIYGLIVGILGASLEIVALFFIATVAGLLLTFPTKGKWNKLAAMIEPPKEKQSV